MNLQFFLGSFHFTKRLVTSRAKFVLERVSLYKRHFLRGILIGLAISTGVTTLAWLGHFRPSEHLLTDFLQSVTKKKADDVVLLFITEQEYKQGFHSISPLSRTRLADTINTLVKLRARVIALDIDMADSTQEDLKLSEALSRASTEGIPVVLIGEFKKINSPSFGVEESSVDQSPYPDENLHHTDGGFLLFEDVNPGSQWSGRVMHGGAICRLDPDGVLRRGEVLYFIKGAHSKSRITYSPVPSFPMAAAAAYQGMSQTALVEALSNFKNNNIILAQKGNHNQKTIHIGKGGMIIPNFIGNHRRFERELNLARLLEEYGPGKPGGLTIFKDKVVIVGGTYDKKDFYATPVGLMSGMEVLANITQSIISDNLITHANFWKALIMEVALGTIVGLLFISASRLWATLICFVILIPMVTTASILSFSNSYYWLDFIPTIVGVMLHGWVKKVEEEYKTNDI